jgi:crossover junction endodeoxyribonuclease RuvC
MARVLGIDPGLGGALAFLEGDDLTIHDMPVHRLRRGKASKMEIDLAELARLIDAANPIDHAIVELVGAMPGQGVSSVFAFGKGFGIVLGILAANFVPVTLVAPRRWKSSLQVPAAKDGARARASQLLPRHAGQWVRVKDDGRAEASLMALYGARVIFLRVDPVPEVAA